MAAPGLVRVEEGLDGEEVVRVGGLDLVLRRDPVVAAVGDGVADDDPDGRLVGKEAEGPGDEGDGDAAFADEPLADLEEDPVVVVEVRVSEGVPARAALDARNRMTRERRRTWGRCQRPSP